MPAALILWALIEASLILPGALLARCAPDSAQEVPESSEAWKSVNSQRLLW